MGSGHTHSFNGVQVSVGDGALNCDEILDVRECQNMRTAQSSGGNVVQIGELVG